MKDEFRNIAVEIEEEKKQRIEAETALAHQQLRSEILSYMYRANFEDDPVELLRTYAEPTRALLGCDQIIYRDLNDTRIMLNSPEIEKTWAVPIEFCRHCEHFDAHHPMYEGGYTEMSNCQEGWHGIPVYKDCPIKSSLTRIVYCNGKVAGYLAIHYVTQYHEFTDIERETIEAYASILSMSLTKYEAGKHATELNSVKKTLSMMFALSDQFDPIMVLDAESGEYDWLMSVADDVVTNTAMTKHGTDFYKDIAIDIASIIHEDDREQFRAFYSKENMLRIAREGGTYEIENRWFITTEGRYKWKYNKVVRMVDNNGKVYVVVGVIDTTEAKEREAEYAAQKKLFEEQQALAENYARFFALEDSFESLYDVNLESGYYEVFAKGAFFKENVLSKLTIADDYFKVLRANIDSVIYEEDREGLYKVLNKKGILNELAKSDHFDYYYRINTEEGPIWLKMRVVYKDTKKTHIIIGVFNASNDVEAKQIAQQRDELQAANADLNDAKRRINLLHESIHAGIWSYEINDKDEVVAAKYDVLADNKVDVKALNTNPMEWVNNLHPDDRERVLDEFWKAIHDHSGNTSYEVTYRMKGVKKDYIWLKTSGRRMQHADGTAELFGMSIDITKQIEQERDQKERQHEAEEAKKLVESATSGYRFAMTVNLSTGDFKVIKLGKDVKRRIKVTEFNTLDETMEPLRRILHPGDIELMEREINLANVRKRLEDTDSYDVEFRVINNRTTEWHVMNVTMIDREADLVVVSLAKRDLETTRKHLLDKRYEEYFALYEIDIDTGMMRIVKDSPYYEVNRTGKSMKYSTAILKFASGMDEEAKAFFEQFADLNKVVQQFRNEDKITYGYQSSYIGNKAWVECTGYVTLRHSDGTPSMFTLGFSMMDSIGIAGQEMQKQLELARDEAEAANRSKTSFLFNMSHDIRTPMNAITGFTNMAKKHIGDKEKVEDYLNKIDLSGQQLLALINQVLEMARIESGKLEIEEEPIDLMNEFNSLTTVLSEQAKVYGLKFFTSLDHIEHKHLLADSARLSSITLNVVGNAMKYTPKGGRIDFRLKEIESRREGYATFKFTVKDTGIGMSEEYLKVLYEPFTREKSSTVSKIQGTGLGMSIVKNLVDLLGGKIEVHSEIDKGTRFDIIIDIKIDNEERTSKEENSTRKVSFKDKRILLVEDNKLNREIATAILEEEGLKVDEAEDGVSAIDILKERGPEFYDYVLMDIQMPIMNGYEATRTIRKLFPNSDLPIIALSANAFSEDRESALAAGMNDHVAKPIDVKNLFDVLSRL